MEIRSAFSFFTVLCVCAAGALGAMAHVYQAQVHGALTRLDPAKMVGRAASGRAGPGKATPSWATEHSVVLGVIQGKTP